MVVRVRIFVCQCVCVRLDRPSGSAKTVENASNAAVELWLPALSPGWRLLAALLSQFSHNHPVKSGHFIYHEAGSRAYNNIVPFVVNVQTTMRWLLLL